jgi:hypothetical protein
MVGPRHAAASVPGGGGRVGVVTDRASTGGDVLGVIVSGFEILRARLVAGLVMCLAVVGLAGAGAAGQGTPTGWNLFSPCRGNCAVAGFAGPFVQDSMADVLVKSPELPFGWTYRGDDRLVGVAVSRLAGRIGGRIDLEPEVGFAQRLGRQDEAEAWVALYGRWRGFPWDGVVVTTLAASTGLSYATAVSDVEDERAAPASGSRLMHYFSPEITLALPSRPDVELLFRFHHRSGLLGLVSEARGGAHYGTVGLRLRF